MNIEQLRQIKTFHSLVRFLRDELDWPIDSDDVEDITFEYDPAELGFDASEANLIKEIKQLRPLDSKQPWGIFWVDFEKKKLPVVVLRRVLGHLVVKKRASANRSSQPAWHLNDLLFLSAYGEDHDRAITLAHFWQNPENPTDLPVLKVLGWDGSDTVLHLADAYRTLSDHLRWPDDPSDLETWRTRWTSAFPLRHREVIETTQQLVSELARLATEIRKRTSTLLARESKTGPLRRLYSSFQATLIHDLAEEDFADVIAQTVTYGLLAAKFSHRAGISVSTLVDMVPRTNPFLRELLGTFLSLGGRKGAFDFDELGFHEIVDLLNHANTDAVKADFGNRTRNEDPVIHFYEHFLIAYDKKMKIKRGIFYTPQPVVSYIVRSVHELLQTEFGIEDGLASTITWREMQKLMPDLKIPDGVSPDEFFVNVLDPATGTATFLVEVIEVIFNHLKNKWEREGIQGMPTIPDSQFDIRNSQFYSYWNAYVPRALLPRLYGYELMMAPYTIAHMKFGLKLSEINTRLGQPDYEMEFEGRAHIYLTNSLEPPSDLGQQDLIGIFPALAHEAQAVNTVKRKKRFTVVIGNPPYSKASQNLGEQFLSLIKRFRYFCGERIREPGAILFERDINNDYVKFFGLNRNLLKAVSVGVFGMITSNSWLDGKNFRGVRDALTATFDKLSVLDLHGDSRSGALARQGIVDENIFEIETGVCVTLATRTNLAGGVCTEITYSDTTGSYDEKAALLLDCNLKIHKKRCSIDLRRYKSFLPSESSMLNEYIVFPRLNEVFGLAVDGIKTSRDGLVIANTPIECVSKIQAFMNFAGGSDDVEETFRISVGNWDYKAAQKYLRRSFSEKRIFKIAYRPLDFRYIYYDSKIVFSHREDKMSHLIRGKNLALVCASRLSAKGFNHILPADCLVEMKYASHDTNSRVFPLFLYSDSLLSSEGKQNIGKAAIGIAGLSEKTFDWMELNEAVFAILNSTKYRTRYFGELKNDFPGIPPLTVPDVRHSLARLGQRLIRAQLLKAELPEEIFRFEGTLGESIKTPELLGDRIRVSDSGYFVGVNSQIFEFNLAGYQVCKNWVSAGNKSGIQRKGTILTRKEAHSYRQILFAIHETIAVRTAIDGILSERLDW